MKLIEMTKEEKYINPSLYFTMAVNYLAQYITSDNPIEVNVWLYALCMFYVGDHSCCELMCTSVMSCLALHSFPSSSSYLPFFLPTLLKLKCLLMCLGFCKQVYQCTTCISGALRGQKRALDPLELVVQLIVSCHVAARNYTCGFQESSHSS